MHIQYVCLVTILLERIGDCQISQWNFAKKMQV